MSNPSELLGDKRKGDEVALPDPDTHIRLNPAAAGKFRRTKIIFTVGPSTASEAKLRELIREGVDICRINMAHASHEWTREIITRVRKICKEVGRDIALLMDIKGPEIRTGPTDKPIVLEKGKAFDFLMPGHEESQPEDGIHGTTVNYPSLIEDLKVGDPVLVDSGLIRMRVVQILPGRIRCKVEIPGTMGSRRHINLPGVHVKLPAITQKDRDDVEVGIQERVNFYALSFVRQPEDIDILRQFLDERDSEAAIIAKIEDQQAISNLDEIIDASDGLMVARGDLGIECPYEDLPIIQHRAVKTCINLGKPVIVATHMLESMMENPVPTRAEVSDVAQAVLELADAIMLSGETTTGIYPLECVHVMKRIAEKMESAHKADPNRNLKLRSHKGKMLRSAAYLAHELDNAAIVVFTRSGHLAKRLSSLRPQCPIYAFTDQPALFHRLMILWGVEPFYIEFFEDPEDTIQSAFTYLVRRGWTKEGDTLIVITNALAHEKVIDTTQIRTVELKP